MQINPYLNFNGNCGEAFDFYQQVLGGELFKMTYGEMPPGEDYEVAPETRDKILHACLTIGDTLLMASDNPPGMEQQPNGCFSVSIRLSDVAEGERIFNGLAEGGKVTMPYQKTFWAERFGMATDRYGVSWMVNCAAEAS